MPLVLWNSLPPESKNQSRDGVAEYFPRAPFTPVPCIPRLRDGDLRRHAYIPAPSSLLSLSYVRCRNSPKEPRTMAIQATKGNSTTNQSGHERSVVRSPTP